MKLFIRYLGDINKELDSSLINALTTLGFECTDVEYYEAENSRDLDFESYEALKKDGTITVQ